MIIVVPIRPPCLIGSRVFKHLHADNKAFLPVESILAFETSLLRRQPFGLDLLARPSGLQALVQYARRRPACGAKAFENVKSIAKYETQFH